MSLSTNLLGLPQEKFGSARIRVGNAVCQQVAKLDKGLEVHYNPDTNKISVLSTSDLPLSVLDKILYECPASRVYDEWRWYPVIKQERDTDGNLEIGFSCCRPGSDTSRPSFLPLSLEPEETVNLEEVGRVEKAISSSVIATMSQFFNKHELMMRGVWYPDDYRKYLREEIDSEMDPSFFTGYAKSEFFEKTGRFTFKLRDGKNASDALMSFLEGPTVADCGNATMVHAHTPPWF